MVTNIYITGTFENYTLTYAKLIENEKGERNFSWGRFSGSRAETEVMAIGIAFKYADDNNADIAIFTPFTNTAKWANKEWKANASRIKSYVRYVDKVREKVNAEITVGIPEDKMNAIQAFIDTHSGEQTVNVNPFKKKSPTAEKWQEWKKQQEQNKSSSENSAEYDVFEPLPKKDYKFHTVVNATVRETKEVENVSKPLTKADEERIQQAKRQTSQVFLPKNGTPPKFGFISYHQDGRVMLAAFNDSTRIGNNKDLAAIMADNQEQMGRNVWRFNIPDKYISPSAVIPPTNPEPVTVGGYALSNLEDIETGDDDLPF